jgi:hypothetical protein
VTAQLGLVLLDWRVVSAADLRIASVCDGDTRRVEVAYHQLHPQPTWSGPVAMAIELAVAPWPKPRRGFGWALFGGRGLVGTAGRLPFSMWFRSSSEVKEQMTAEQARLAAADMLLHVVECHQHNVARHARYIEGARAAGGGGAYDR